MIEIFDRLSPMLLNNSKPFNSSDYIFELKLDGFRCLGLFNKDFCKFKSRNGNYFLNRFSNLETAFTQAKYNCIVDGELVAIKDGIQNRHALNNKNCYPTYAIFDILYLNDEDLTHTPQLKRKEILKNTIIQNENIIICDFYETNGIELFNLTKKMGLEGVVAKRKNGFYYPNKRTSDWLKIRCDRN